MKGWEEKFINAAMIIALLSVTIFMWYAITVGLEKEPELHDLYKDCINITKDYDNCGKLLSGAK